MNIKFHIIVNSFLLLTLLLFTSCRESANIDDLDGVYPIEVEAYIDPQYTSRVVRLSSTNLSEFGVFSFYKNASRARNLIYTKTGSTWKGKSVLTWATGAMDFYGLSPSFAISTTNMNLSMNQTPKFIDYRVPTNYQDQIDIMYSSIFSLSRTDKGGKIAFSFKPGMHYLSFVGKNSIGSDYKVFVKSIILHNIINEGQFTYNQTKANTASWVLPTSGVTYVNDTINFITPVELTSTNSQMLGSEYLIIIPQKCTKWNTTAASPIPITTADANHNYYIETVAQIIKKDGTNEVYLLGNVDNSDPVHPQYESVYFPVVAKNFLIGSGSSLPIMFNGGYNEEGKPYLENNDRGEGVEVEVSEWMDFDFEIEEWTPIYEDLIF